MNDEEAREAVLAEVDKLLRPITVSGVASSAAVVLAPDRLFSFNKWLDKNGEDFCARVNSVANVDNRLTAVLAPVRSRPERAVVRAVLEGILNNDLASDVGVRKVLRSIPRENP